MTVAAGSGQWHPAQTSKVYSQMLSGQAGRGNQQRFHSPVMVCTVL